MSLEGSTPSCNGRRVTSHDCPKTVFGKSWIVDCSLLVAKCPLELTLTPMEISFNDAKLNSSDRQAPTQRAVKCWRCSTFDRMSRPCRHRPSRIQADGEHFNEKPPVDLCDWVDVNGNRYGWLVAVDRHSDCTVVAPCPSSMSQAGAEKWRTERFGHIKWRVVSCLLGRLSAR